MHRQRAFQGAAARSVVCSAAEPHVLGDTCCRGGVLSLPAGVALNPLAGSLRRTFSSCLLQGEHLTWLGPSGGARQVVAGAHIVKTGCEATKIGICDLVWPDASDRLEVWRQPYTQPPAVCRQRSGERACRLPPVRRYGPCAKQ